MDHPFVVCTPYYGNHIPRHIQCMDELDDMKVPIIKLQDQPYLDIARSILVCDARRNFPYAKALFFIDHDMIFDAMTVIKMARRLIDNDLDMTGAGYSVRVPGNMVCCQPLENKSIKFYVPGFEPAKYVATGFTCINYKVFEKLDSIMPRLYCTSMQKDFVPYFERYIKNDTYHPDDIGFCYRIRDLGMKVWIDTEPRVYHRGSYDYALEDAGLVVPNHTELTIHF